MENTFKEYKEQEDALSSQKSDLEKTGEDLAKTGADLETESVKLNSENSEIKAEIAIAEDEVAKSEMKETTETEEKLQADVQVDVPVQNNKGWEYYADLELKAAHGNDSSYKPSAEELKAKSQEIMQRNIENGNVGSDAQLRVGSVKDPKYVTLNGEIDTSGLQTTEQASVKYNQGQAKLAAKNEVQTAKDNAALEEQRVAEARNFSVNLGKSLDAQDKEQEMTNTKKSNKPQESKYVQFYANSAEHSPEDKTLRQAVDDGDIAYSEVAYGDAGGQIISNFTGSGGMAGGSVDAWQTLFVLAKKAYQHITK